MLLHQCLLYKNNFIFSHVIGYVGYRKDLKDKKLNNLKFETVKMNQFHSVKLLKLFKNVKNSLYETVLVSANDELVSLFLRNKIRFLEITKKLIMIMNLNEFKKMKQRKPKNFDEISKLNKYVRLKTYSLCVRSKRND